MGLKIISFLSNQHFHGEKELLITHSTAIFQPWDHTMCTVSTKVIDINIYLACSVRRDLLMLPPPQSILSHTCVIM